MEGTAMSDLLSRVFPEAECDPIVGVPRIYAAEVCRSGFIADGMTVVDNEGRVGTLAERGFR